MIVVPTNHGSNREILGFGALSVLSFVLNVGVTFGLVELAGMPPELAFAVGISIVLFTSFFFMRTVVFPSKELPVTHQLARYLPSTAGFRITEYVLFLGIHTGMGVPYQPSVIGVLIVSVVAKFLFYRTVVFH